MFLEWAFLEWAYYFYYCLIADNKLDIDIIMLQDLIL